MYQNLTKKLLEFVFLAAVVSFIALAPQEIDAATLHTIMVADTLDATIGKSTDVDLSNMRREMLRVAQYSDLDLKETIFKENDVHPDNVLEALDNLEIESDDVVFFYFSGHGYRTEKNGERAWPNLYFSVPDQGVDLDFIGKKLENYKPRLLIVMADACNNVISEFNAPNLVSRRFEVPRPEDRFRQNYRKLFVDSKGIIIVTSSQVGEYSWSTAKGGLFTIAFLNHLRREVMSRTDASWSSILDRAAQEVEKDQHPDYSLYLE